MISLQMTIEDWALVQGQLDSIIRRVGQLDYKVEPISDAILVTLIVAAPKENEVAAPAPSIDVAVAQATIEMAIHQGQVSAARSSCPVCGGRAEDCQAGFKDV